MALVENDPGGWVLRIIAEHYALHGSLPTTLQVYHCTEVDKQSSSTRLVKLSEVEKTYLELQVAGWIGPIGKYTRRSHLTEVGFPWIARLLRYYCLVEVQ